MLTTPPLHAAAHPLPRAAAWPFGPSSHPRPSVCRRHAGNTSVARWSRAYRAPAAFPKCGRQAPRKTNRVAVCHRAPARLRAAFLSSSSGASIPARHGPLPLCRPGTSHLKQPTQEGSHARRPRGHVAPASSITRPRAARPACRLPSPPERAALAVVATPTAIARLRACALRCECPSHQSLACARTPLVGCFT